MLESSLEAPLHTCELRLTGPSIHGTSAAAPLIRDVLSAFVDGAQQAVRLRVEGRSRVRATTPGWLTRASAFDIDTTNGLNRLLLSAAPVVMAVPEKFQQLDAFSPFDATASCLDLLVASLGEAARGEGNSELFDDGLIETFSKMDRLFRHGLEHLDIVNGRMLRIDRTALETIDRLRKKTPEDRRVVVAGRLETIGHASRLFELDLSSGERVKGIVVNDEVTSERIASLFGKPVTVSAIAKFRPSGTLLRLEADRVSVAGPNDLAVLAAVPKPFLPGLEPHSRRPPRAVGWLDSIYGKWPGDETDQQISEGLKERS